MSESVGSKEWSFDAAKVPEHANGEYVWRRQPKRRRGCACALPDGHRLLAMNEMEPMRRRGLEHHELRRQIQGALDRRVVTEVSINVRSRQGEDARRRRFEGGVPREGRL